MTAILSNDHATATIGYCHKAGLHYYSVNCNGRIIAFGSRSSHAMAATAALDTLATMGG